jgi:hypothetical protein
MYVALLVLDTGQKLWKLRIGSRQFHYLSAAAPSNPFFLRGQNETRAAGNPMSEQEMFDLVL